MSPFFEPWPRSSVTAVVRALAVLVLGLVLPLWFLPLGTAHAQGTRPDPSAGDTRLTLQTGHQTTIQKIVVSTDGRYFFSGDAGGTVIAWDVASGRQVWSTNLGRSVSAFAPVGDGRPLVCGTSTGDVVQLDPNTGVQRVTWRESGAVSSLAWSPEGRLAVALVAGRVVDREPISGVSVRTLDPGITTSGENTQMAFSADGTQLGVAVGSGELALLDWQRGAVLVHRPVMRSAATVVGFQEGSQWVVVSANGSIRVVDERLNEVLSLEEPTGQGLAAAALALGGRWLVASQGPLGLRLWDLEQVGWVRLFEDRQDGISAAAFDPQARLLVTGGRSGGLLLWEVATGKLLRRTGAFTPPIQQVQFSSDGSRLIVALPGVLARTWDLATGRLEPPSTMPDCTLRPVVLSPDGGRLFTLDSNNNGAIWKLDSPPTWSGGIPLSSTVQSAAWSSDGQRLLLGGDLGLVSVVEASSGATEVAIPAFTGSVHSVAWAANGAWLAAVGGCPAELRLWSWPVEAAPITVPVDDTCGRMHLLASPAADLLAVTLVSSGDLLLINPVDGGTRRLAPGGARLAKMAFSEDGRLLAAGDVLGVVSVWAVDSGERLLQFSVDSPVVSLDFSPAGDRLAVADKDRWVGLWRLTGDDAGRPGGSHLLARMATSQVDDWVVADSSGRFDSSGEVTSPGVHWVVAGEDGPEVIYLSSLRHKMRSPDLLRQRLRQPEASPSKEVSVAAWRERGALRDPLPADVDAGRPSPAQPRWTDWALDQAPADLSLPPAWEGGRVGEARMVPQAGHDGDIISVSTSADGRYLVTGADSGLSILWETSTGRQLRSFSQDSAVMASALSPRGTLLATGEDNRVRLWDVSSGQTVADIDTSDGVVLRLAFAPDGRSLLVNGAGGSLRHLGLNGETLFHYTERGAVYTYLAFTPDGQFAVACASKGTVWTWDLTSRRLLTRVETAGPLDFVSLSPGGRYLVGGNAREPLRVVDRETGRQVWSFQAPYGGQSTTTSVDWSRDRRQILVGDGSGVAFLVDVETGESIQRYEGGAGRVLGVAMAPGRQAVVVTSTLGTARVWQTDEGVLLTKMERRARPIIPMALSTDGSLLACGGWPGGTLVWDLRTGEPAWSLTMPLNAGVADMDFTPDGRFLVLITRRDTSVDVAGSQVMSVDMQTGERQVLANDIAPLTRVRVSPDGELVAVSGIRPDVQIFRRDGEEAPVHLTGPIIRYNNAVYDAIWSMEFSPDGEQIYAGRTDGQVLAWQVQSGALLWQERMGKERVRSLVLSPTGDRLFAADDQGRIQALDALTGAAGHVYRAPGEASSSLALSLDGHHLLAVGDGGDLTLWDLGDDQPKMTAHQDRTTMSAAQIMPSGDLAFVAEVEGGVRLWDLVQGRPLASLLTFTDGSWGVMDDASRFDASVDRDSPGLFWVLDLPTGPESIDLDQLKAHYYEPGLLAKRSGWSQEPLRDVVPVGADDLPPAVELKVLDAAGERLQIFLRDRGGGMGRVALYLNGREIVPDARGLEGVVIRDGPGELTLEVEVAHISAWQPGQGVSNEVSVKAFNADDAVASRGVGRGFAVSGGLDSAEVDLWAIVVGVSDYAGDALDLRFSSLDAQSFARALAAGASQLLAADNIHLTLLESPQEAPGRRATRANLEAAFAAARQAGPEDLLVIFLAGHGIAVGDGYYFPTSEAAADDLASPAVLAQRAISSAEILEWSRLVPANKQVLVLDTCHAGAVLDQAGAGRSQGTDWVQRRAMEELKDRMGIFILAGASADKQSFEGGMLGHGLLTYGLLSGMRGEALLKHGNLWDVDVLFDYAVDRVPELAARLGYDQRPVKAVPVQSRSFAIGRLTPEVEEAIPLRGLRPFILRSRLQHEEELDDVLGLGVRVDQALREREAGPSALLAFVDAADLEGSYRVAGRYQVGEAGISARLVLRRDGQSVAQTVMEAPDADTLAQGVATWVEAEVGQAEMP